MASNTLKFVIPHCTSLLAADNPDIPAPMMTTHGCGVPGRIAHMSYTQ